MPPRSQPTLPTVAISSPARPLPDVEVTIESIESIEAEAQLPGEVAGPAVAVRIVVTNRADRSLALDSVVVDLTDSTGSPGGSMSTAPARPLPDAVAAAGTADGVYVFTVAPERRSPIEVTVSVSPSLATVVFRGPVR